VRAVLTVLFSIAAGVASAALDDAGRQELDEAFQGLAATGNVASASAIVPYLRDPAIEEAQWQAFFRAHYEKSLYTASTGDFWNWAIQNTYPHDQLRIATIAGLCAAEALSTGLRQLHSGQAAQALGSIGAPLLWLYDAGPDYPASAKAKFVDALSSGRRGAVPLSRLLSDELGAEAWHTAAQLCLLLDDYAKGNAKTVCAAVELRRQ
jgi:hypothetical protein